jgi:hypothetical protein
MPEVWLCYIMASNANKVYQAHRLTASSVTYVICVTIFTWYMSHLFKSHKNDMSHFVISVTWPVCHAGMIYLPMIFQVGMIYLVPGSNDLFAKLEWFICQVVMIYLPSFNDLFAR